MATFVLKVKYGEVLGRVTVPVRFATGGPTITYNELVETIRQKFKLPVTSEILVTYADNESDVVTMTNDQDLHDALVLQGLNPLRLSVATAPAVSHDRPQITNGEHMMNGAAKVSVSEVVVESQLKAYSSQPDSSPDRPGMSTLVAKDAVQHLGIRCDMCTMCPIIGTRYKSKKQRDYDLCMSCFQDYGSEDDYMKIERPRIRPPTERPAVSMYYTVALNS